MGLRFAAVLLALGSFTAGCAASSTTTSIASPSTTKCEITATSSPSSFGSAGGSGTIAVDAERECSWAAHADASWVVIAATSGQGSSTISYAVAANPSQAQRRTAITVGPASLNISQDGAPPPPPPPPPAPSPIPTPAPPAPGPSPKPLPPPPSPPPPAPPAPAPPPAPPAPEPPRPGKSIDLKGKLSGLTGACPNMTFVVDGRTVATDGDTEFEKRSCGSLGNGVRVEVKGRLQSDGTVRASKVDVKKDDDD